MIDLIFDTETTGKYDFRSTPDDPAQPHLLQLCCLLAEGNVVMSRVSVYVRPIGEYRIPLDAARIHGITHEIIDKFGISTISALALFHHLALRAQRIVAHNTEFDFGILKAASAKAGKTFVIHEDTKVFCTMRAATSLCKLPGNRPGEFKWPRLEEAHHMLVGPLDSSTLHDAEADALACHRILCRLDELAKQPPVEVVGA